MGAKHSKQLTSPRTQAKLQSELPAGAGAVTRKRRTSVSAEVDATKDTAPKKVVPKTEAQLKDIEKAVANNFLFSSLPAEQLKEVVDAMEVKSLQEGDVAIKEGNPGDFFYVIQSGELQVFVSSKGDAPLRTVKAGDSFGELALMYNAPRSATVKAATPCQLWALDRRTFRNTIMASGQARRKKYEDFLAKVELLAAAKLGTGELAQLADAVEPVSFEEGEMIIRQGDADRANFKFYIIEEGEAKAYIHKDGSDVLMSVMGPGEYFGEKALVEQTPRTASVVASVPVKCAALSIAAFERLMGPCEGLLKEAASKGYHNVEDVASGRVTPKSRTNTPGHSPNPSPHMSPAHK